MIRVSRLTVFALIVAACSLSPHASSAQNLLNNPESVVFDAPRNRYLVSNWGDGGIVQIDEVGAQSYFSTDLLDQFQLAALYIQDDTLLVAAGNAPGAGIFGFDLATAAQLFHLPIPGIGLPNDIASDADGILYVTDYWGDKLYRIAQQIPALLWDHGLDYPNGMAYDAQHDRLLILSVMGPGSPILGFNLADSTLTTVRTTGFSGTDGITLDSARRVYVSEWGTDAIHRYDSALSGPPELFSTGHDDPADIYFDAVGGLIAVPSFSSNSVEFVPVTPTAVESIAPGRAARVELFQNQPNPFNPRTAIRYRLEAESRVILTVHNPAGALIRTLVDDRQPPGFQHVVWDGVDGLGRRVSSGLYVYRLRTTRTTGGHASDQSRKMLLLR